MVATPIVKAADVARRLRIPQPLDEDERWQVEQAILDAQSDLEAYLGRPATTSTYTETGLIAFPDGWQLENQPVVTITSVTPEVDPESGTSTGLFTVVYVAGLDGVSDPELEPLRRFVRTHAMYSAGVQELLRTLLPESVRKVKSASVEGQSVTYADVYASTGKEGTPGALPTLASCDRWRVAGRRVFQRRTPFYLWPYDSYDYWRGCDGPWVEW